MSNLMELLQGQLSDELLDQLGQQIGSTDRQQTATAANGVFSTLIAALNKNASGGGVSALSSALDRDHDGSILDDLAGMLTGTNQQAQQNTSMLNGAGILKHVLGGSQNNIVEMIARMSGLNNSGTGKLMVMLAPMVMGMLGKQKRQNQLDDNGLSDMLSRTVKSQPTKQAEQNLLTRLLDQDGDGSVIDDVAGMLGKFLRR